MTKETDKELLVVAAGHSVRLDRLRNANAPTDADDPRAAADALLPDTPQGDSSDPRAAADRLLGRPHPLAVVPQPVAVLSWDAVVAVNREELDRAGCSQDALTVESLLDEATLAQVEREWREFSTSLDARLDAQAADALLASFRRAALDAITRPLGLGRLVERLDRKGGGVLTPHNAEEARQGRLATEDLASPELAVSYAERQNLSEAPGRDRHHSPGFRRASRDGEDAYRDTPPANPELDHVIPASRIDTNKRVNFYLSEAEKEEKLINSPENLAVTDRSINRSKRDEDLGEWMDQRRADGSTNEQNYNVNRGKAEARAQRAKQHVESVIASKETKYLLVETAKAGAGDAVKAGLQQALGAVLVELAVGLFDEVADLVRHGRQQSGLVAEFAVRARRVADRVLAAWRDVVDAFAAGGLAGFLSAVVTAIINAVVTTAKRVVRILREGALSLLRALKMMLSPPPGMEPAQAAHEASKLLAAAVTVSVGIAVEEVVEKAIVSTFPVLAPVAPLISTCVVGLATGVSSVLLAWLLDKVDFFGAVAQLRGEERLKAMYARTDEMLDALLAAG